MMRLVLIRLAQAVPVLLIVAAIAFALVLVAGDPVGATLGADATAAQREAMASGMGLDASLPERYLRFLAGAVQGDFGVSTRLGRPVGGLILERLPATIELAGAAFVVAVLVGVPCGVLAAIRPRAILSRAVMALSLVAMSLPTFMTGTLLIMIFAAGLRLLPSFGRGEVVDLGGWTTGLLTFTGLRALVLPALTLAFFQGALLLRLVRDGMVAALASEFIRFGRARGLPRASLLRHAFLNAVVPAVTAAALQLGMLVAFAVVTETVFQWPGVGLLLVQSIAAADVPVIAAYLVLVALLFVLLNIAADLLCLAIDPRLRVERRPARRGVLPMALTRSEP